MKITEVLPSLKNNEDLSEEEMSLVVQEILEGSCKDAQIIDFLAALSSKGESVDEIVGAASVMRKLSQKVVVSTEGLVDTCGTGGSGIGIFNVSTAASFVASACGAKVAKHGNRTATRKSGSADLLEQAGISLKLNPSQVGRCIEEVGIGFMFAPAHHSAMKHVAGPRKEMGVKTIFNILGPLTNPANAPNQVMGVYTKRWLKPMAEVLKELGSKHVLVVHSKDSLDEISIADETYVTELINGSIKEYTICPEDFGFSRHSIDDLLVQSPEESLLLVKEALRGENEVAASMVAMNAGAVLYAANVVKDIKQGVLLAKDAIESKKGLKKLNELASFSKSLS